MREVVEYMKINRLVTDLFRKGGLIKPMAMIGCLLMLIAGSVLEITAQNEKTDDFPIPESYKTEGIPPIKKFDVEHLFYDPSTIRSNLIWDTDTKNRRLLVTDETNNIHFLTSPLAQPVKLIEKVIPYSVRINPNGKNFAYNSDHEDEDNYQLYLYDFNDKTSKKLVDLVGKDESIESFVWSKNGDALHFMRVDYDGKTSKLCKFDFIAEKCFPVELKGTWSVIQAEGNKVILKNFKSSSNQLLYVYDYQLNKLMSVDEKGNSRKSFLVGDRVFWTSEGNEYCKSDPCLLSMNLKNNKIIQVELPKNLDNMYEVKFSPDGNNILIQETREGVDHLRIFRLKKDKIVREFPQFINGSFVIWNTRWLSDNEVAYTLENSGKPASIQSYNLDTKKTTDWTKERLPALLENKVKPPKVIKWKSFDGREISGYIIRPQNESGKTPVMIFIHGGPTMLDRPGFSAQDIRLSSKLGLTIIHTNIRGSSGFGKEFMDADNKENRVNAVKDIQSLIDWIKDQPDLDSNKIFLRGESYGGFIAFSTALQEPKDIKGVIAEYPLVSIRGYLSQSWIDEAAKNEYGDPKDESLMKKLDELSPLNNMGRWNKIPVLLTRGRRDERVPEKDVTDLKTQLQNNGTELWYIFSNEDGHGFGGKYVFAAMYQFLKKQINKKSEENR
jgi:dipeptidyl aminopeptidase/acylaminoacyl peptidase